MIEVGADYPLRGETVEQSPDPDVEARRFALQHWRQGHVYRVWTAKPGAPVSRIDCGCGIGWLRLPEPHEVRNLSAPPPATVEVDRDDLALIMGGWMDASPDRLAAIRRVADATGINPPGLWR